MTINKDISVYKKLGVTPIINGRGCITIHGGKVMSEAVVASMLEASKSSVLLNELIDKATARLAELTGAEGAFISSGAASGLFISGLACLSGSDPDAIQDLPEVKSGKNEFVISTVDDHSYVHQAFRGSGGSLVCVGTDESVTTQDYEDGISDKTAGIIFFYGSQTKDELAEIIELSKKYSIPVVVDCAAQIPPKSNLTDLVAMGVDLVVYSGGKGIGGPQCTGLILGKKDLINACRLNSNPNSALGRSMKVGKEEIVGLVTAVEELMFNDEESVLKEWISWCELIVSGANGYSGVIAKTIPPYFHMAGGAHAPASPTVEIDFRNSKFNADDIRIMLENNNPPIMVSTEKWETDLTEAKNDVIVLGPGGLQKGEAEVIGEALKKILTDIS
ncbi:MAG: aminotransferase class V-fold PLP-dependent enzyme [Dehalococcoidia bacterium]